MYSNIPKNQNSTNLTTQAPESPKELLNRVRVDLNSRLADTLVTTLQLIQELEEAAGKQDYKVMVLRILEHFPEVNMGFLAQVLPENQLLASARNELESEGVIEVTAEKNRKIIRLRPQPVAEANNQ